MSPFTKVYTSDCVGCTTEGVTVRLLGERNFNYMQVKLAIDDNNNDNKNNNNNIVRLF